MAYAIPAGEAAWIADALARAYDPDAVRAVFEEARTRFEVLSPAEVDGDMSDHAPDPTLAAQTVMVELVRDLRAQVAEALRAS